MLRICSDGVLRVAEDEQVQHLRSAAMRDAYLSLLPVEYFDLILLCPGAGIAPQRVCAAFWNVLFGEVGRILRLYYDPVNNKR